MKSRTPLRAIVVLFGGLVGLSLTRTRAVSQEHELLFTFAGASIALVAVLIAGAISPRIAESLPPLAPRQLWGLKTILVGFLIALSGWLVASFIQVNAGIAVAALGIAIGFVGMAIHFYLMLGANGG